MNIYISETAQPLRHDTAMRTLTFVGTDDGDDAFSDFGIDGLMELYEKRLLVARLEQLGIQVDEDKVKCPDCGQAFDPECQTCSWWLYELLENGL